MAYDLKLADRVRENLAHLTNLEGKEMMGGLSYEEHQIIYPNASRRGWVCYGLGESDSALSLYCGSDWGVQFQHQGLPELTAKTLQ